MYEFHGWATIRDSAGCEDEADDPSEATVRAVTQLVDEVDGFNRVARTCLANGSLQLSITGLRNHHDRQVPELFGLIAQLAPGSYGILYVLDDEDETRPNEWVCHVLRRGEVREERDMYLSPHVGFVEDDCSPNG